MSVTSIKDTTRSVPICKISNPSVAQAQEIWTNDGLRHSSWMCVAVVPYRRTDGGNTVKNPSEHATKLFQYDLLIRSLHTNRRPDGNRGLGTKEISDS